MAADSAAARADLARIVRSDRELELVAQVTPRSLERVLETVAADVVLERSDRSASADPVASVVLVADPRAVWEARRLDAASRARHAILADDASPQEILSAVRAVAAGLIVLHPRALAGPGAAVDAPAEELGAQEPLTPRERAVLDELARGVGNRTIAERLAISEHTVKYHVASIYAKLGVANRTEAVAAGIRRGLVML